MFGNPETTPGGKALKFYASVRLDIRRKDTIKDDAGNATGNHVRVKVVKNKVAPPFAEAEFDIIYNHGINKEGSILDVGIECGVVDKKGAWLQFDGELIGQGKEAAQKALAEKPELAKKIVEAIMAKRGWSSPKAVRSVAQIVAINYPLMAHYIDFDAALAFQAAPIHAMIHFRLRVTGRLIRHE